MNFQRIFKRETKLIVYVVSALTIVLIGATYALFFKVKENSNNQVVEAGALIVEYSDSKDTIIAESEDKAKNCLYPTDDADGNINGCLYEFTITNNGSLDAEYTIYLTDDLSTNLPNGGKLLDHQYIKHTLRKKVDAEGTQTVEVSNSKVITELEKDEEKGIILEKNKIGVNESITFSLRVWIDEEAPHGDDSNSIVGNYVRLKINASSIVYEDNTFANYIKTLGSDSEDENVCGANGIVEVKHDDADIADNTEEYTKLGLDNETVKANLKMTEYRYCGSNPNNYVKFNNELWRIIGLVNTPEGQRIKIIRATPLYLNLSWDNKPSGTGSSIDKLGSNDWSDSKLQELLNKDGAYYNRTSGSCPTGQNNATTPCDFGDDSTTPGLTAEAKNMIDTITWNLGGTASYSSASNGLAKHWYNYERGTIVYTGKERPTLWQGEVGLMYPSDYGYATGGGSTYNRGACLSKELYNWSSGTYQSNCAYTDWLLNKSSYQWTLSPHSSYSRSAFYVNTTGYVNGYAVNNAYAVAPVLYLKSDVQIGEGSGLDTDAYTLEQG